jgi:predicted neutral ceramidase superfamily lipid hydrolase
MGMVERIVGIANRMTLQNVINMGVLVGVAIPAFAVWRFLTDPELREDFFNTVKERHDIPVNCAVFETRVSGIKRFHVQAFVLPGPDGNDYNVGGRMHGSTTPKQIDETCKRLNMLADHLREKVPEVDERYHAENRETEEHFKKGGQTP